MLALLCNEQSLPKQGMIQHAARRAYAASLRQSRVCRWRLQGNSQPTSRSHSAGPISASEIWADPSISNGLSIQQTEVAQESEAEQAATSTAEQEAESVEYMFDPTPTTLGRNVSRMVGSGHDTLQPEVVELMVSASSREAAGGGAAADTFTAIAKAHRKQKRPHLTLHLCQAVEGNTGSPLVPSTPEGLVLLLDAMQPKTARHAVQPEGSVSSSTSSSSSSSSSSESAPFGGERAVKELLRRYEEGGKEVPMMAYKAAVKALDGPDHTAALEMARRARSKLGDSAEDLGELYTLVMKQCGEHQAPDAMLAVLGERRRTGGTLAPDGHAYVIALACLGKAKRVSEALDLFGEMLEEEVKPSAIAVNHMLAACARDAGDFWKHAKAIFEGMEQRWGIKPNVYHYTSLVTCLLKAGQWREAVAMADRMEGDGITPTVRFLDHMMQASIGAKQWVTAEAIFRAMTEKYGHSNVVSRQSTLHFIQSMVMQKKLRKVISYVARIQDFPFKGPPRKGAQRTMDACVLKWFRTIPGVGAEALAGVLMTMLDKGVNLHPDSYSIVISKANQDGNKDLSATLYKMLLASEAGPSLSAINAAIKGCTTIEDAMGIMASLRDHRLTPDKFTYAALLHCCSAAVDDNLQGERATQVWEAMSADGIRPHGGMLASYLLALMRSGKWETALEVRERYRNGGGSDDSMLSHAERHVGELDFVAREEAVVDSVVANGLVDNRQSHLALPYVLNVLKARQEERSKGSGRNGDSDVKRFVDEDNHTILAGIRACKTAGSGETAMSLLAACEERWATGPLLRDVRGRGRGGGDGLEGGQWAKYEWRDMLVRTRLSRRRLYDCLISLLDSKGHDFEDIRRVLESGMKNGAVSLMKDHLGGMSSEQAIDFHGWSLTSARCIVRCIFQDILTKDQDFLLEMGQYDLGRAAHAQGQREFGNIDERWHVDSPDPRGRRRQFADGVAPARFAEREYGQGRKKASVLENKPTRWEKPGGGWDGQGSDETQARWWERQKRLSLIVGKPRPPPCIRSTVEEWCMLGVSPPLRIRKDTTNPGILTIEAEDVRDWIGRKPSILP